MNDHVFNLWSFHATLPSSHSRNTNKSIRRQEPQLLGSDLIPRLLEIFDSVEEEQSEQSVRGSLVHSSAM